MILSRILNRYLFTLVAASGLQLNGSAATPPDSGTTNRAVLRVGVTPNSPPMIFKENGHFVGVEAECAEALGHELGREVTFVEQKREDLIDALCDGRLDIIMSALSITPARSYRIVFSNPYLEIGQTALARADEKYKYLVNLAGEAKRGVGVKPGTTAEFLIRQEMPTAKLKYYSDGDKGATALLKKKIDLFISDGPMIWYLAGHYESKGLSVTPLVLSREQLGWGMRRTDPQLLDEVNAFLKKAQANGQLNLVMSRWMPGFR
jgi:polar amino acid transport system substrate-binding protein